MHVRGPLAEIYGAAAPPRASELEPPYSRINVKGWKDELRGTRIVPLCFSGVKMCLRLGTVGSRLVVLKFVAAIFGHKTKMLAAIRSVFFVASISLCQM